MKSTVNWKGAANQYGEYMTVEDIIVSAKCLPKVSFLNFDKNCKTIFTAVIFASDLPNFPSNPDLDYLNIKIKVTGSITEYKGKPEIIVKEQNQIKIAQQMPEINSFHHI